MTLRVGSPLLEAAVIERSHSWVPPFARTSAVHQPACCCPAAPAYQVLMPPTETRPAVELLLCGHHYRASGGALRLAGAYTYDVDGHYLGR